MLTLDYSTARSALVAAWGIISIGRRRTALMNYLKKVFIGSTYQAEDKFQLAVAKRKNQGMPLRMSESYPSSLKDVPFWIKCRIPLFMQDGDYLNRDWHDKMIAICDNGDLKMMVWNGGNLSIPTEPDIEIHNDFLFLNKDFIPSRAAVSVTVGGSNQFQDFSKSDKYVGKNEVDKFMKLLNSQQGPLIICDSTMHTKGLCRTGMEPVAGAVILPTWIEGFQVGIASFPGLSLSDSNGVMKSVVRLLLRKTDLRSAAVVPMEMSLNAKEGKYSCMTCQSISQT